MMSPRTLSILIGAGSGALLAALVGGSRLTWTTVVLGAALVGVVELVVGNRGQLGTARHQTSTATAADAAASIPPISTPSMQGASAATTEEPAWHESAMTSLPPAAAAAQNKPAFVRPPLSTYAGGQRIAQQCPRCGRHQITHREQNYQCEYCASIWTWQLGEHWPEVRPQPNLQEVTRVPETS